MFVGKTLAEVAEEASLSLSGYRVMILKDEEDDTGERFDELYSIKAYSIKVIIKHYPEIANYRVKFENDFFGELVLRVIKE